MRLPNRVLYGTVKIEGEVSGNQALCIEQHGVYTPTRTWTRYGGGGEGDGRGRDTLPPAILHSPLAISYSPPVASDWPIGRGGNAAD